MSRTRIGKIARLPKPVRDELALRLRNAEPGRDLVKWLNGLPHVRAVLEQQFEGRPITEQNLSEWRQSGYFEWLRLQESRSFVAILADRHEELDDAADGKGISDRYARLATVELARIAATLVGQETDPEKRWQRLCEVLRELSRLRRDDHSAARTLIARQQWDRAIEREDNADLKALEHEERERGCAPLWALTQLEAMGKLFGGGDLGRQTAAKILEIEKGLRPGAILGTKPSPRRPQQPPANPPPGPPPPLPSKPIQTNPN